MTDPQDVHGLRVVVEAIDHPILTATSAPAALEFSLQRLAAPSRVAGKASEDERQQCLGHSRRDGTEAPQGSSRQDCLVAHARLGPRPRASGLDPTDKATPAEIWPDQPVLKTIFPAVFPSIIRAKPSRASANGISTSMRGRTPEVWQNWISLLSSSMVPIVEPITDS